MVMLDNAPFHKAGAGGDEREGWEAKGCASVAASSYCPPLSPIEEVWRRLPRAFPDAVSLLGLVGRAKADRPERLELAGGRGDSPSAWRYLVWAIPLVYRLPFRTEAFTPQSSF